MFVLNSIAWWCEEVTGAVWHKPDGQHFVATVTLEHATARAAFAWQERYRPPKRLIEASSA